MSESKIIGLVAWTVSIFAVYTFATFVFRICYNVYFHPLAKYPGPKLLAASWIPHFMYKVTGRITYIVKDLHDQYGPVVRTGPDELAFISGQAWRDIYGHSPGLPQNRRDPLSYTDSKTDEFMRYNMLSANDKDHARQRSQLSHAFSRRALEQQLPLISGHIDKFVHQLHAHANKGPQDIGAWYVWLTFDIIGDLMFGEPFGCLDSTRDHPWMSTLYDGARAGTIMAGLSRFGINPVRYLPNAVMKPRHDMVAYCREHIDRRLAKGEAVERSDFMTFMMTETKKGDPAMTTNELHANAEVVAVGGSETSATLLTGMTFLLLSHRPDWLAKLTRSIRNIFKSDDLAEMNFQSVSTKLPLLSAAVTEALRIYPPVPTSNPRLIEMKDRKVEGATIPIGTAVTVYQWAAGHAAQNWHRPEEFLPERWLSESDEEYDPRVAEEFKTDRRDSINPFSLGSRGCLGRNLAEMEMRLIFARLLYNFDLELVEGQQDWMKKQPALVFWIKDPLMIRLKSVRAV